MFHFAAAQSASEPLIHAKPALRTHDTGNEKRQITRNRQSYSCLTCRRRKVKCDKMHPVCGGCKKANEHCLYTDEAPIADPAPGPPNGDEGIASKKRKTRFTREESSVSSNSLPATSNSVPPSQLKAIEKQLFRLTSMVDQLRKNGGNDPHLLDLLTPVHSGSDQDSDEAPPRLNLSLDMFQTRPQGLPRDGNELSRPLSDLKLTGDPKSVQDIFWTQISDEVEQLNHVMRRDHQYAATTSIQTGSCPSRTTDWTDSSKNEHTVGKDDFWDPMSFQKEAALGGPFVYNIDSECSVCQLMPFSKSALLQGIPVRCVRATATNHLVKALPSRSQSNTLLRCWLSSVYPIMPILIVGEVLQKHEAFWDQMEAKGLPASQHPDLEFYALIHAIWYAGTLSISSKGLSRWFPGTSRAKLASSFHDQAVFCLHLDSFPQTITLYKLAALIVLNSLPVAEEEPVQRSLYMQLTVRLALTMGLHREPTLFNLSVAEGGMRRRLWWQIVQLDTSLMVSSGYPSLISEAFSDTRINCEDDDAAVADNESPSTHSDRKSQLWGEAASYGDNANPTSHRTMSLVARAKSIMACALRTVISTHLSTKTLTNVDMQELKKVIQVATDQIDDIILMIPAKGLPELGFVPDGPKEGQQRPLDCDPIMSSPVTENELVCYQTYVSDSDLPLPLARYHRQKLAAYNKWARISLSMLKDKLHCVTYAPFLKNARSRLWSVGRQCALHNCHSFLRKFTSLAADPDLEHLRWCWPATYGPMHAAVIVLVDLYQRPGSVEAPRSRELIDQVFSLSAPENGIVGGPNGVTAQRPLREGGVETWDMLRGLRSAAWQKAGLDPTVLWTQADQVETGIAAPLTDDQRIAQSLREDTIYENDRAISNGVSVTKVSQNGPQSSESGVRYMVKLAQSEIAGVDDPQGFPCSRALRNQFLQDIENDKRLNATRGLARREGQQRIPFPLSGHMEACSKHAANSQVPLNGHGLSPTAPILSCGSAVLIPEGNQTGQSGATVPVSDQIVWNELGSGEALHLPSDEKTTNGLPFAASFEGGHAHPVIHQHEESLRDVGAPNTVAHDVEASATTADELGFDWERWDAVFGQYSGFTDLMEDVTWELEG